jgi:ribosomal protein L22
MTEKAINPKPKENKAMQKQAKLKPVDMKNENAPSQKEEKKIVNTKEESKTEINENKTETKKEEKKSQKKVKKDFVVVNGIGIHVSRKVSSDICRFIKYKTIDKAIADLEEVAAKRKAVPMRGEIPHRKGKIMAGRFPQKAAKAFIILLKSLKGNANNHDVEEPIISEAFASKGPKTLGRGGRTEKKRTHIKIVARERKEKIKEEKK